MAAGSDDTGTPPAFPYCSAFDYEHSTESCRFYSSITGKGPVDIHTLSSDNDTTCFVTPLLSDISYPSDYGGNPFADNEGVCLAHADLAQLHDGTANPFVAHQGDIDDCKRRCIANSAFNPDVPFGARCVGFSYRHERHDCVWHAGMVALNSSATNLYTGEHCYEAESTPFPYVGETFRDRPGKRCGNFTAYSNDFLHGAIGNPPFLIGPGWKPHGGIGECKYLCARTSSVAPDAATIPRLRQCKGFAWNAAEETCHWFFGPIDENTLEDDSEFDCYLSPTRNTLYTGANYTLGEPNVQCSGRPIEINSTLVEWYFAQVRWKVCLLMVVVSGSSHVGSSLRPVLHDGCPSRKPVLFFTTGDAANQSSPASEGGGFSSDPGGDCSNCPFLIPVPQFFYWVAIRVGPAPRECNGQRRIG